MAVVALQDKASSLARPLAHDSNSQLVLIASSSCQINLCKVEFNQPSCWLYSLSNLLVF